MRPAVYAAAQAAAQRILVNWPCQGALDAATLAELIDSVFWTSLRRDEIYIPKISLAYVAPEDAPRHLRFAEPLKFTPRELTKVAAAVERAGIHLGVWPVDGVLQVWGICRALPLSCLVLEVVVPGIVVVKRSPATETGKFINVGVMQGDETKIIDPDAAREPDAPELLKTLLGGESQDNVLLRLAVSTRAHGRGGLLLIVPPGSSEWKDSVHQPVPYAVEPSFAGLAELFRKDPASKSGRKWEEALARLVDGIAGLTAVDGATVITSDYELLAFGAKIVRRRGSPSAPSMILTEPVEGNTPVAGDPAQLGGTRHLSAVQFVHDQRDSLALVASQDGRFTALAWSPREEMVHAHRIDALLL